jgi:hypothetical protein
MSRLEKLIEPHLHKCTPLKPKRYRIHIKMPGQIEMFEEHDKVKPNVVMGWYYEIITSLIWGGKLTNHRPMRFTESNGENFKAMPDVWRNKQSIGESKACRVGHSCSLYDNQLSRYYKIQCQYPGHRIYFSFYRHRFKSIRSYDGTMQNLFYQLSRETVCAIVLPFSIVHAVHRFIKQMDSASGIGRRSKEKPPLSRSMFSSPALNNFFCDPEGALKQVGLNGLDVDDFLIQYHMSPNWIIDNVKVPSFPIVRLRDKQHNEWFRRWRYEEEEDIPF